MIFLFYGFSSIISKAKLTLESLKQDYLGSYTTYSDFLGILKILFLGYS